MWFGTEGGGVSRYDGRTFVNFTSKDGLADDRVRAIYRDPDGVMWFGTELGGVSCYDGETFINFATRDGLAYNQVSAIHRDPDGIMWFGTSDWPDPGGGVSRYDGETFVNFTTKDGLAHNTVNVINRGPDGAIWFGTSGGISCYDGKAFVNFTTEDGLPGNNILAILCDPDGVLWFGTQEGVSRYDGRAFVNFTMEDGLVDDWVVAIHRDPDGVMWFGTIIWPSGGGASRYDGKTFVNFCAKNGLAAGRVLAIYCDPDGVVWFGTDSGVSRYDGKGFLNFTTEDGLVYNRVCSIYRDLDGVMWFGTWGGVSKYDGAAWTSLDTRDGLAGNRVESILQDPDGFLWFATWGGVTRYRRSTTPPKVRIVSVITDQTYRDLSTIPPFTPGTRVTIEYSSIDFKTLPEKRQYRCRIQAFRKSLSKKEMDSDWRKPTRSTSYDFIFDKPGIYTFEVQAIDRDLNYSEPASLRLEVIPDPRNYQIAQLKGELAERERAEMERIYQELEDARQIQQSLLPDKPPQIEGFEIAGTSIPAREVSGDFYDYLSLGANVGIVLADVTGKSVQAAMVAAMANGMLDSEIRGQRELWDSPGGILKQLNIGLQPRLTHTMFTAMSLGILQVERKRLLFSNAGMPYPIVKRGREVRELMVNGLPLGITDAAEYNDLSVDLEDGDFIVFYSDGVIEAENEAGDMYQTERLLEIVQEASSPLSAQEMVDLIVSDVTAFAGDLEASDDITVVVIRCDGCDE
jgi:serine phosphatase RsbU (regulator of sigma subunit)/streptogramin lyase